MHFVLVAAIVLSGMGGSKVLLDWSTIRCRSEEKGQHQTFLFTHTSQSGPGSLVRNASRDPVNAGAKEAEMLGATHPIQLPLHWSQ